MNKIAFVILNYKTPMDTISLVKNLQEQKWNKMIEVFIVDNGSGDNSIEKLSNIDTVLNVEFIKSNVNLGFAKGNNLGIKMALSKGYKYIIVSNSDISLDIQDDFIQKIFDIYENDNNIAIIAPFIKNFDGIYQNPFRVKRFDSKKILKMKLFYLLYIYKIYYYIRVYILYDLFTYLSNRKREKIKSLNAEIKKSFIYAPHGSFLIFTPAYFRYFDGFDKNTFLFCEEFILAEMLISKRLKCWFENSLKVVHKESQSTNKIINNYKEKVKFTLKHTFKSCRYFAKIIKIR